MAIQNRSRGTTGRNGTLPTSFHTEPLVSVDIGVWLAGTTPKAGSTVDLQQISAGIPLSLEGPVLTAGKSTGPNVGVDTTGRPPKETGGNCMESYKAAPSGMFCHPKQPITTRSVSEGSGRTSLTLRVRIEADNRIHAISWIGFDADAVLPRLEDSSNPTAISFKKRATRANH